MLLFFFSRAFNKLIMQNLFISKQLLRVIGYQQLALIDRNETSRVGKNIIFWFIRIEKSVEIYLRYKKHFSNERNNIFSKNSLFIFQTYILRKLFNNKQETIVKDIILVPIQKWRSNRVQSYFYTQRKKRKIFLCIRKLIYIINW